MKTKYVATVFVVLGLVGAPEVRGQFTPGHVFVAALEADACQWGREAIVEIHPATGEMSVFADSEDGMCIISGLRFTPDGQRLLLLNLLGPVDDGNGGFVRAFNPDGSSEVILDASDGLLYPLGSNGLAFDAGGDLYVVNDGNSRILRFPADGGPPTVFADAADGIRGEGPLDFAPNGDLFYAGPFSDVVIRITPEGESSLFDTLPEPSSLVFDRRGNLFVAAGQPGVGGTIYRYDNVDPTTRRILASGFDGISGSPLPLTLSPDATTLYLAQPGGPLYAVDAEDGTTRLLADLSDLPIWEFSGFPLPVGMAVYVLPGDMDGDGDVDVDDFAAFDLCFTGPDPEGPDPACQRADMNGDGDVDWGDFALFQLAFTGP